MVIVDSYVSLPESIQYEYTVGLFQGESTVTELLHTGHLWDPFWDVQYQEYHYIKIYQIPWRFIISTQKYIIISTYTNILLHKIYPIQYNQHILSLETYNNIST